MNSLDIVDADIGVLNEGSNHCFCRGCKEIGGVRGFVGGFGILSNYNKDHLNRSL